jgi:hypothetical protein
MLQEIDYSNFLKLFHNMVEFLLKEGTSTDEIECQK